MKLANVCPIFKKNDKNKCENYRPISLLSNLSKNFERIIHTRLYDFLDECNIFYDLQFGFRKRFSTNHALLSIVEDIRSTFFFYKQPGCLGVRPQNWPKIKQHAKQLEASKFQARFLFQLLYLNISIKNRLRR